MRKGMLVLAMMIGAGACVPGRTRAAPERVAYEVDNTSGCALAVHHGRGTSDVRRIAFVPPFRRVIVHAPAGGHVTASPVDLSGPCAETLTTPVTRLDP